MVKFKSLLLTSLFLVLSLTAFSQNHHATILWGTPLSWNHFKGNPQSNGYHFASANMGVSIDYSWKHRNNKPELKYIVNAIFNPSHSWVKPGKKSSDLLRHEQVHFDITELMARRFRKFLTENNFKSGKVRSAVDGKYKFLQRLSREIQECYDQQTNHGSNSTKQLEWERKICIELASLQQYQEVKN